MKKYKNNPMRLSRVLITGTALSAILAAGPLLAQNTTPPQDSTQASSKLSHRAKEFLKDAAQANQTEIAMANVAEGKTQNEKVKELAHMMLTDHEQNYSLVKTLAQTYGLSLEPGLDMMNKHEVNRLTKAHDADFDKEFTKEMLKDHVKCIKRFDKAAQDLQEQDIRQYALNTLPALRHHLEKSEEAARSAGVEESTIASILKELPPMDRPVTTR